MCRDLSSEGRVGRLQAGAAAGQWLEGCIPVPQDVAGTRACSEVGVTVES